MIKIRKKTNEALKSRKNDRRLISIFQKFTVIDIINHRNFPEICKTEENCKFSG